MKIEKLNENQIRCTLTQADLEARHLRLSELAYGTEKAKELFRDMMQQANSQFGFEADNIPLMIEAVPTAAGSIVLIISKVEDPEELDTRFSKFTPFHGQGFSSEETPPIEVEGADDILDLFHKIYEAKMKALEQKKINNAETQSKTDHSGSPKEDSTISVNLVREYVFPSLDAVIDAAHGLNNFFQGANALYKDSKNGFYSLVLRPSDTTPENFNKVCNILSEYGKGRAFSHAEEACFAEHGTCVIAENALQKLTEI